MTKIKNIPSNKAPLLDKKDLPKNRKSAPPKGSNYGISYGGKNVYGELSQDYIRDLIPIIRWLAYHNEDMGQVVHNIVTLGNTTHKIMFDRSVQPDMVDKMRDHIKNKKREWSSNQAGIEGVINKMIAQILIGGALSGEWVPKNDLSGINNFIFVNPEEIYFKLDRSRVRYIPYQKPSTGWIPGKKRNPNGLIKLNPNTYRYYALNGDTELPFGIPPYIPALPKIRSKEAMDKNIDYVVDQLGLMGFLQVFIDQPPQEDDESDEKYIARLNAALDNAGTQVKGSLKNGVVVGFKDTHDMDFQSVTKDFEGVKAIYENNELQIASGLKQDASLWGRTYSSSETQINIIFIKMLSELKNIQHIVAEMLEFGYSLELRLAGYKFNSLSVQFDKSTIQDDLKYQQGREIKIRNLYSLYCDGIISLEQYADELGYEKPDQKEPRIQRTPDADEPTSDDPAVKSQKKVARKKQKTASDKKTRDKNKPVNKVNK